jgi:response regulator RpfG family c-di-GMP phosphodiesterase/serine/threonine protein kinase
MKMLSPLGDLLDSRPVTVEIPPASLPSAAQQLLQELLTSSLIRPKDWENLAEAMREDLSRITHEDKLLAQLVDQKLLTEYQAGRISAGTTFGLILGNYRVLGRLGAGGMGVVFKAEHLRLPKLVAIKVLPVGPEQNPRLLQRFYAEMWAIAQLQHPNIVGAIDTGEAKNADANSPNWHYFVMDYVAGEDLEAKVLNHGSLSPITACDLIHQVASALEESHKHNLVHRDIKPSNVLVTPEGQAKLLDFGLVRQFGNNMTEPGTVLGTLDYVAPEQASDASSVDIRADIYGLGGTLFWCLTGRTPFPSQGNLVRDLLRRMNEPSPSARALRPEIPAELDAVLARMMAVDPAARYTTPQAVMRALLPFLQTVSGDARFVPVGRDSSDLRPLGDEQGSARVHRVLIVDDESDNRNLCGFGLTTEGIVCDEAANGVLALEAIKTKRYDLVLSDIDMPEMTGPQLLKQLREIPPYANLKIIMFSGRASADEMAQMMSAGADDYLTKPLSIVQLLSRVKAALRLKDAQDRSDLLNRHMLEVNAELERNLTARDSDLVHARNALVLALAELVSCRDTETGAHLTRLQRYCRCLSEEAASFAGFADQIDANFIQMLECCAPLHDIGKVGLPDHILLKSGKLDSEERILMQTHTTIGADTLKKVASQHGFSSAFLQMAGDIARHHHERYDGKGYPDRLAGNDIPLAARIVAIADVYDALRSRRTYKPALSHSASVQIMTEASAGHFDPQLLHAFRRCASQFERIAKEVGD